MLFFLLFSLVVSLFQEYLFKNTHTHTHTNMVFPEGTCCPEFHNKIRFRSCHVTRTGRTGFANLFHGPHLKRKEILNILTTIVASLASTLYLSPAISPHHATFSRAALSHLSRCCCASVACCSRVPCNMSPIFSPLFSTESNFLLRTTASLARFAVSADGYRACMALVLSRRAAMFFLWASISSSIACNISFIYNLRGINTLLGETTLLRPLSEGIWCAGKQAERHRSCLPCIVFSISTDL